MPEDARYCPVSMAALIRQSVLLRSFKGGSAQSVCRWRTGDWRLRQVLPAVAAVAGEVGHVPAAFRARAVVLMGPGHGRRAEPHGQSRSGAGGTWVGEGSSVNV